MSLKNTFVGSLLRWGVLIVLWLGLIVLPPRGAAGQPPKASTPLKLASLLNQPLAELERQIGKPRHVGTEQERYYKVPGLVRVIVRPTPQKTLAALTIQFAPKTVKDELGALELLGFSNAVLPDRWSSRWQAPGDSGNDELMLSRLEDQPVVRGSQDTNGEVKESGSQNVVLTRHFLERMKERGVSEAQARDLLANGKRFYDPKNDSYIRYKDGIYLALTRDGVIKTVVRGPVSKRWQPL